jgi:hypothetical protein
VVKQKEGETMSTKQDEHINHQTVGNLKRYLEHFPDDAKVRIYADDLLSGTWLNHDCRVGGDFEHQHETNTVQFFLGLPM